MKYYMCKQEFVGAIFKGLKLNTIRPPRRNPPVPGEMISLRTWTGKPYWSPQNEFLQVTCRWVLPCIVYTNSVQLPGVHLHTASALDLFAVRDGFVDWPCMRNFFNHEHSLPFCGQITVWRQPAFEHTTTQKQEIAL